MPILLDELSPFLLTFDLWLLGVFLACVADRGDLLFNVVETDGGDFINNVVEESVTTI